MAIPAPNIGSAALVTGASSGIGRELARLLCQRGHDTVLVARRRHRLEDFAEELRERYARRIEVITCDVSEPSSRAALAEQVEALGLTIDVLVLAAGFGMGGAFTAHDPDRTQLMLRTNLEGVVALTGAFAPSMERRRQGAILIVSSITGNQPMPNFAAYAATKAAVTSFAEALHEELRPSGVTVTAVCPGPVHTEFTDVADMARQQHRAVGLFSEPDQCARAGIDALRRGRRKVVPRVAVKALHFFGGHAPRRLWLPLCRCLMA